VASIGRTVRRRQSTSIPYVGAAGLMGVNAMGSANITVANTFNPFGLNLVADKTLQQAQWSSLELGD
jgi:hypothetical protein